MPDEMTYQSALKFAIFLDYENPNNYFHFVKYVGFCIPKYGKFWSVFSLGQA